MNIRPKVMMNFTTSEDDITRYCSAHDLRSFYRQFHLAGLELMPMEYPVASPLIEPDMIIGIHTRTVNDWMESDIDGLLRHYRQDLDYAQNIGAEYIVFHVSQISCAEGLGYPPVHTHEEVIDASADFINALLEGQNYSFWFLMENMWYPGLDFCNPDITRRLLDGIRYEKKGLMLDTGHFLHTNTGLASQDEAVCYILRMLDQHRDMLSFIKGIHLHQSLSGDLIRQTRKHPPVLAPDPAALFAQLYEYVFQVDRHEPFTTPAVNEIIDKVSPAYITLEYITTSRKQHERYLAEGTRILSF